MICYLKLKKIIKFVSCDHILIQEIMNNNIISNNWQNILAKKLRKPRILYNRWGTKLMALCLIQNVRNIFTMSNSRFWHLNWKRRKYNFKCIQTNFKEFWSRKLNEKCGLIFWTPFREKITLHFSNLIHRDEFIWVLEVWIFHEIGPN